ncbi:membrane-associated transporter protein-like [Asterias rubens]|uniref:membrane-associated transporter protein-like n=1 Tax=Asterias rubens TaxID=7604 RepID=UPI001455D087|nr:membrane-associated transporter protein-like [Asterias rubens]
MVSGRINSACTQFWTRTKSLVTDCIPRRVRDDLEPIIPEEERQAVAAQLKSRLRLARLSGAVCGIEFCYAAETAFVSPVLLRIGIPPKFMTLIWCLSPIVGLFLMPLLGSASDRCKSSLGRRRPFIILLAIGAALGLLLVPYGWPMGNVCGVTAYRSSFPVTNSLSEVDPTSMVGNTTTEEGKTLHATTGIPIRDKLIETLEDLLSPNHAYNVSESASTSNQEPYNSDNSTEFPSISTTDAVYRSSVTPSVRACGMALTIVGVMMLDFNCDAAQSPARAYLIDVTDPADHAKGLATFSFMAGLGGAVGYTIGGIPWGPTADDDPVSLQVRVVFGIVLCIFITAVILTVTAEREKTLYELYPYEKKRKLKNHKDEDNNTTMEGDFNDHPNNDSVKMEMDVISQKMKSYGSHAQNPDIITTLVDSDKDEDPLTSEPHHVGNGSVSTGEYEAIEADSTEAIGDLCGEPPVITMGTYLMSIIFMPRCLRVLCFTHLLGWMSLLCYSLYFTDFVGQAIYGGSPLAAPGTVERHRYAEGVRMGSWAMAMYSITCSICSYNVDKIIAKVGAKPVYIANHLVYCVSMVILANVRTLWAAFLFSACAGIQYSTLFTVPFVILAHYHSSNMFDSQSTCYQPGSEDAKTGKPHVRGLGTDIALVQGMVFIAQLALSSCMGSLVQAFNSNVVIVVAAAILSFLGAISASQVTYAGL